jgi:hypothetical protein
MPADPIVAYLEYLRQMSRKIAYRGTTVDVLGGKSRKSPDRYLAYDILHEAAAMQRYLNGVATDNQVKEGRTLFIGIGLIVGTARAGNKLLKVSAPLIMVPCLVDAPDEMDSGYDCSPEWDAAVLNYDLISALVDKTDAVDTEDAMGMPDLLTPAVVTAIEQVERKLREATKARGAAQRLTDESLAEEISTILRSEIPALRSQITTSRTPFRKEDSRPTDGLVWFNHRFYFMATMPDSLSAYRALNQLSEQFHNQNNGTSATLRQLLTCMLKDSVVAFRACEPTAVEQVKRCLALVPLPLSLRQQQAVMNAFASDLSYIQGPPGTGKSHTIAATMLSALLQDKRVLLTSQKKAAIDVVRAKLSDLFGGEDGADISIYVGRDTAERSRMRAKINNLISDVQSNRYPTLLSNAKQQEDRCREDLQKTLRKIAQLERTLKAALERANEAFRANSEHLDARASYHDIFGEGDLSSEHLASIGEVTQAWEPILDAVGEIQTRRTASEQLTVADMLRVRIALGRYATLFAAPWITKRSWDTHRLQAHFRAVHAHDCARKAEKKINVDLNQIRRNLAELNAIAIKQAKEHLRALTRHTQLRYARDCQSDLNNFASLFWLRKARLIKTRMAAINYAKLTKVFPLWLGEMSDLGAILPFQPEVFDLAIVDEASQVNIAEIIPVFHRAKSFCVVGDRAQLGLEAAGLFGLNRTFEQLAWNQAFAGLRDVISYTCACDRQLDVSSSSILDFLVSPENGLSVPKVTLDEHYRSMPALAAFTSSEFYCSDGGLRIMTEVGQNLHKECFKLIETGGLRAEDGKYVPREVDAAMKLVSDIISGKELGNGSALRALGFQHPGRIPSVGIITFTSHQRDQLRARADDEIGKAEAASINLFIGTPEEFQGNERDVMIITFGLGEGMPRFASAFYENPNRFNVATSRARKFTYAIIGRCPAKATMFRRYFGSFGFRPTTDSNIADITDGTIQEPTISQRGSALTWSFDERRCESEFERVVLDCIRLFVDNNPDRRLEIFNQVTTCGQKRLDFVLFDRQSGQSVAIEVDGQDHFCTDGVTYHEAHIERASVLNRAGWKIVHVPHYKWYRHGWIHKVDSEAFNKVVSEFHGGIKTALGYAS